MSEGKGYQVHYSLCVQLYGHHASMNYILLTAKRVNEMHANYDLERKYNTGAYFVTTDGTMYWWAY